MHNNPFHPEPRAARLGEINVVCRGPVNLVVTVTVSLLNLEPQAG
jgi:hypothetical protein